MSATGAAVCFAGVGLNRGGHALIISADHTAG